MNQLKSLFAVTIIAAACLGTSAQAQIPVTDGASIATSIANQVETIAKWAEQAKQMKEQIDTLQKNLEQAKQIYGTLQGARNLGSLLNNDLITQYLPQDYAAAAKSLQSGVGDFQSISGSLQDIVKSSQLKSCSELNADPKMRDQCNQQWQQLALSKQVGDMGYRKASENIKNLQTFVSAINSSTDQKAISEVQARIQVETVRMQNEQIKLATIQAMEEADRRLKQQQSIDNFNNGLSRGSTGGIRF